MYKIKNDIVIIFENRHQNISISYFSNIQYRKQFMRILSLQIKS